MQAILNETINQFHSLFMLDFEHDKNEELLKQMKQRARGYSLFDSLVREQMDNLIKQPNEFAHHKELIIKMQAILNETINQFHSLFMFDFEHDKNQELLKQMKQRDSQIEIQISFTIDNQQTVEYKKSKTSIKSSTINEKSLDTNQINEQIHEYLNNYDTILQKHIQNDQAELSKIQTDIDQVEIQTDKLSSTHIEQESNKIMHQQTTDTIEDLHRLSILLKQKDKIPLLIHNNLETSLEKFQQENNREKQIDIQLQILDKIDQLDNQFINHKTLENLRKHLHEEQQKQQQASLNLSSDRQMHSDTHIQIMLVPTHLSKSSTMTIDKEKQIKNISHQTCY
ncbi:unnamed protein product [Rotaria sp. Silwood1]|nr:unnamed protein product [Rotaria sp. Silwood1]